VALYDLRMSDGSGSRVIQKYRPSGLNTASDVSVSGLDVSKDKRELLVSYENDQVRNALVLLLVCSLLGVVCLSPCLPLSCRFSHFRYFRILRAGVQLWMSWENIALRITMKMKTARVLASLLRTAAI